MGDSGNKKRKRGGGGEGGWSSDDSLAAEERAEHHYMLHVGDEVDHGRYSVMSQLGKGTFGRVVEMWDKSEKRFVAVKVVRAVEKCASAIRRTAGAHSECQYDDSCIHAFKNSRTHALRHSRVHAFAHSGTHVHTHIQFGVTWQRTLAHPFYI